MFDFHHHTSRKKQKNRILDLLTLSFVDEKKDVILIGNPGVGKSFVGKCVACAATRAGIKTLFTTAADMINHLNAAEANNMLPQKLRFYQAPALLPIDEIGCLPLGDNSSNLFFQVITARHGNKSTISDGVANSIYNSWRQMADEHKKNCWHNTDIVIKGGLRVKTDAKIPIRKCCKVYPLKNRILICS